MATTTWEIFNGIVYCTGDECFHVLNFWQLGWIMIWPFIIGIIIGYFLRGKNE